MFDCYVRGVNFEWKNINIKTSVGHFHKQEKYPQENSNSFPLYLTIFTSTLFIYIQFFILISLSNEPKLNYSPL